MERLGYSDICTLIVKDVNVILADGTAASSRTQGLDLNGPISESRHAYLPNATP